MVLTAMTTILALLGVVVAVFGALIGYNQWRTAHQRVVLDLFERRLSVFQALEESVKPVFQTATVTPETFRAFLTAMSNARFLFGTDVNDYLRGLQKDFAFMSTYTDEVIANDPKAEDLRARRAMALMSITDFAENAPKIFGPYMRMDQKMPSVWWPF